MAGYFSSTVAIIGGGASGTLVASHLLKNAPCPLRVVLYEPRNAPGMGVAYGTNDVAHCLNVPAGKMSALANEPGHFLDWLNAPSNCASLVTGAKFGAGDFVSRAIYSRYLAAVLEESIVEGGLINARFEHRREKVVDFIPGENGGTLVTEHADTEDVTHVVLALGNLPPRDPLARAHPFFRSARYVADVWREGAFANVEPDDDLLIVGTGLTALDVLASLHRRQHRGKIFVTSRNGRLPHFHETHAPWPDFLADRDWPATTREWVRLIRGEVRRAAEAGSDWRPVFDAIRPHTQKIWLSLERPERLKFLRHVRSFWECHRHRAPGVTWSAVEQLRASGQLVFVPGRIRDFEEGEETVRVSLQRKGAGRREEFDVAHVLNCIGPESNFRHHLNDPLIINLIARGVLHPDPLYLGIEAMPDGRVINAEGAVYSQISTLGPPMRGVLWETTAIPEIRGQAERLAQRVLENFHIPAWQI